MKKTFIIHQVLFRKLRNGIHPVYLMHLIQELSKNFKSRETLFRLLMIL